MTSNIAFSQADIDYILSPQAVREKAAAMYALCCSGKTHFQYHAEQFDATVEYVIGVIKKNYPDLNIPFHSRWGHFRVGGIDRIRSLDERLPVDAAERCRAKIDLVVTSVLLDAGAGDHWKYMESSSQTEFNRSEGLAVASLHLYEAGGFSSSDNLYQADGEGLCAVSEDDLCAAFQVSDSNPLLGMQGRVELLKNLGRVVQANNEVFALQRPGCLYDYIVKHYGKRIEASDLLKLVLLNFGDIWPGRIALGGVSLGDVWQHPLLGDMNSIDSLIPFHKLSQWLTYSLMEPLMDAGIEIVKLNGMTGLPEYRNGGLLVDSGLLSLRDPEQLQQLHRPDSELIVEWRALTVYCLDRLGEAIRVALDMSEEAFPLVKVLEGGTWWAGRFIAREKRPDGSPPLNILSDGTVF